MGNRLKNTMKVFLRTMVFVSVVTVGFVTSGRAAFQEALWGARPAAMVGAYTAVADDSNSPAYNPAGITWMTENEMTFMYARLFSGLDLQSGNDTSRLGLGYFSYVPKIKDKAYGSYAFSWSNLAATNLYREDSFALTAADSYQFDSFTNGPVLSYGANLKYLRRSFSPDTRTDADPVFNGGDNSSAFTVDMGLQMKPNMKILPGLKLGLAGQNLTEPDIGLGGQDRVPMRVSFGAAYQDKAYPLLGPALEVSRRNGRTLLTGAWEAWVARDTLAFRAGMNADEIGGGMGYQFHLFNKMMLRLDYAILWPLNVDGTNGSHRVSISAAF